MQKTIQLILAVIGVWGLGSGISARAQTVATNATTLDSVFTTLSEDWGTNYAIEPYATYAKDAPQQWGGGLLAIYNVNNNVGLGLGVDWLGDFSLLSVNATLGLPFHPLKQFPTLTLTPFVLFGVGTASSGAGHFNGDVSTIQDIGGAIKFGHAWGGQFNAGVCWGQWTGVGKYDVKREHFFLGWNHGF